MDHLQNSFQGSDQINGYYFSCFVIISQIRLLIQSDKHRKMCLFSPKDLHNEQSIIRTNKNNNKH